MRHAVKRLVPLILFFVTAPSFAQESNQQVSPEKRALILRLMEITGVERSVEVYKQQMAESIGQNTTPEAQIFFAKMRERFNTNALKEIYIPIYSKHFSDSEIKGLISFYETPLGKKVVAEMPSVLQESMQAGGEWGRKLASEILQEMKSAKPADTSAQ